MEIKKILLFLFVSVILCGNVDAQSCAENLYKANKLLDAGKTDECLAYLRPCSDKSNEESIRWQAFRLMSLAFLIKGMPDSAKVSAENMLDINPTYIPNLLKDPKEFINVLNKIVVIPKFTLGLAFSAGTNITLPKITKGYVIADYEKTYSVKSGMQFGTNIGFYLSPKLSVELGVLATSKKYNIDYSFANWNISIKERLTYLDLPLMAKYIFRPQKRLRFYAQGGAFIGYLLYAQNDFSSTYTPQEQDFKLTRLNIIERRNKLNFGLIGGLGAYYKVKQGHLCFTANYFHSLPLINNPDKRYNNTEQIYTYYYVDDNIKLNNIALSIGYTYYLNYKVYRSNKLKP